MKKTLILFTVLLYLLTSCEDDDFCNDPTTPRLIIVFYDTDNPTEKKEIPIYVWADNKDSIYQLTSTDSILIPLDTGNTFTKYRLATENVVDTLDLTYTTSDLFVSESCGYIAQFNDFEVDKSTYNWIDYIEVNVTKIEDETETHIKIFH
ncbi:DUF6452 family protein [Flavicella sp.]|uniref:DUF6452 family protein n=1 Tax=Flavicella sp. TaxID=2957742 RepID=UPI003015ACC3